MKKRFFVCVAIMLLIALLCGSALALDEDMKKVYLTDGDNIVTEYTTVDTLGNFFATLGITLNNGDTVNLDMNHKLEKTNYVIIKRAVYVITDIDGSLKYYITKAETVEEFIEELKKDGELKDKYFIENVKLNDSIKSGMEVKIITTKEVTHTASKEIPFVTIEIENPKLPYGEERIVQEGAVGEEKIVVKEVIQGGSVISSEVIETSLVKEPVDNIIEKGTSKTISVENSGLSYSRVINMRSTAYSRHEPGLTDYTATGAFAEYGVVAVDPSVIPLGTKLYVEGYGVCSAEDTGGAIKGNRIDLCFNSVDECIQYGVRDVNVYVLN